MLLPLDQVEKYLVGIARGRYGFVGAGQA